MLELKKSNFENTILVGVINSNQNEFKLPYIDIPTMHKLIQKLPCTSSVGHDAINNRIIIRLSSQTYDSYLLEHEFYSSLSGC